MCNKGLIVMSAFAFAMVVAAGPLAAQVYKVVDENGNVTYTDRPPADGSAEIILPEISVVETEPDGEGGQAAVADSIPPILDDGEGAAGDEAKSPRELRRMFRDFRILSPGSEETYWGTANTVVVSWGASSPYEPGMSVSVVVDGQAQDVDISGNLPVTLDRGEHQVYAVLRDQRGRRIVTTPTVTFHVKQGSRLINPG